MKKPCKHHWRVELPAARSQVKAVCFLCGVTREFDAAWSEKKHYGLGRYKGRADE